MALVQRKLMLLLFNFFVSLLFHAGSKLLPIKITNPKPAIHTEGEINYRYVQVMRNPSSTQHIKTTCRGSNLIKI